MKKGSQQPASPGASKQTPRPYFLKSPFLARRGDAIDDFTNDLVDQVLKLKQRGLSDATVKTLAFGRRIDLAEDEGECPTMPRGLIRAQGEAGRIQALRCGCVGQCTRCRAFQVREAALQLQAKHLAWAVIVRGPTASQEAARLARNLSRSGTNSGYQILIPTGVIVLARRGGDSLIQQRVKDFQSKVAILRLRRVTDVSRLLLKEWNTTFSSSTNVTPNSTTVTPYGLVTTESRILRKPTTRGRSFCRPFGGADKLGRTRPHLLPEGLWSIQIFRSGEWTPTFAGPQQAIAWVRGMLRGRVVELARAGTRVSVKVRSAPSRTRRPAQAPSAPASRSILAPASFSQTESSRNPSANVFDSSAESG